ncbi:SPASM domain-containing protein [Dyadobacter sp. CY261]|uniref:SPASM domain-containing protein n=1 Tax=Dyadobacter sp. CY261 TaxID=2907203 RepID=UPI0038D3E409
MKPDRLGFQTCASGFSGGAIYVDGTFQYCHVHFGQHTGPAFSIFDDELDLVDMINLGAHHEEVKSDDCKKCRYRFVCTSGCPVYRIDGKDPQCSLYHKFIPMFYSLVAKERLKLLRDCKMIT